jgi:cytochrome b561
MTVARYHPLLVALHWFLGTFLILDLLLGTFLLKTIPNASPDKLEALAAHMTGGMVILLLMGLRLMVRTASAKPPAAIAGHRLLDALARVSHVALYVLVFSMVATGLATALIADLFAIVFAHSGSPLPATFDDLPTRVLHGYVAKALVALIALHVTAALYHQFVRRDGLLRRMWFGRRFVSPHAPPSTGAG